MNDINSDIDVALTTTKHTLVAEGSSEDLLKLSAPICVANMCLGTFGLEYRIEKLSQTCRGMAKTVYINPEKKYIFIGENPAIPDTALVEYTEKDPREPAKDFFTQWENLHMLLFEFVLLDLKGKPLFVLKGLWNRNKWHSLDIRKSPTFNVLKEPLHSWGTFSTHNIGKINEH